VVQKSAPLKTFPLYTVARHKSYSCRSLWYRIVDTIYIILVYIGPQIVMSM